MLIDVSYVGFILGKTKLSKAQPTGSLLKASPTLLLAFLDYALSQEVHKEVGVVALHNGNELLGSGRGLRMSTSNAETLHSKPTNMLSYRTTNGDSSYMPHEQ